MTCFVEPQEDYLDEIEPNGVFMEFYLKLRWIVPGRTRIIGTKTQEIWKLRRPNIGICTAAGMLLGYVLPKLLEMMMYG